MIRMTPSKLEYVSDNGKSILFTGETGYVAAPLDLSSVPIELIETQGIGRIGAEVHGQAPKPYTIPIQGTILGETKYRKKHLHDVFAPTVPGHLIYNDEWKLRVYPNSLPAVENKQNNAKFHLTVRVAYPYWLSKSGKKVVLSGSSASFKFPVNYGTPHIFGERLKGMSANAENKGNVPVRFVLIFVAHVPDVVDPQVINVETREFIKINRTMELGEFITVDMTVSPMTVVSTIGETETDIFEQFELDSTPFFLKVGDNILQDMAESNHAGMDCWVSYNDGYSGVW